MSEIPEGGLLRQQAPEEAAAPGLSVGSTLKALREARGLSLSDVSARIKYSTSQLQSLEDERWTRLPRGVSLRGLVRNYARYLNADVDAVLLLLDDAVGPTGAPSATVALNPRRPVQETPRRPRGEPAHRTWAWLLLILVLVAILGFYALDRGWIPDEWLIFDWLKALRS